MIMNNHLLDVIQSGREIHNSGVGIYAPDAEANTVFADLFEPIIEDYHGGFKKTDKQWFRIKSKKKKNIFTQLLSAILWQKVFRFSSVNVNDCTFIFAMISALNTIILVFEL